MKISRLILAFLAAALLLPAPGFSETPEIANTEKTALHKNFFDIPVAIAPKMGYNFEKIENGVADKKKKIALEGLLLHMPFQRLMDEISHDALKKGDMEVKSSYPYIWNGSRARLMKIFAKSAGGTTGKWVLIVERGEDRCWMISGSYNAKDMQAAQYVLDMIGSAWWEDGAGNDADRRLCGSVDPEGTPFRFAGLRQGALIYTKDGKIPTESADGALFVVSSPQGEYPAPEKRAEFALREIRKVERDAELEIIARTEETLNGLPSVEITAKTKDGRQTLIYQRALFHGDRVTMLVGIAREERETNLADFRNLAATYREKPAAEKAARE